MKLKDCAAPAVRRLFENLMMEIKVEDPRGFANFVRMDAQQFQYLLDADSPLIVHKDKAMSDTKPPAEPLTLTRRCLSTRILHTLLC